MEDLLVQIADLLDMSVEGVIQAYPILREQFMIYYTLDSVRRFAGNTLMWSPLFLAGGVLVALLLDTMEVKTLEETASLLYSKSRTVIAMIFVLLVISFTAKMGMGIFATDIMIIKELL